VRVWRVVSQHIPQKRNRRKTGTVKPKNGLPIAGQTALYRSLPYWRAMLNRASGSEGVVLQISILGDISYASPRVTTTLGYAAKTLIGRNILALVFEDDRKAVVEAISRAGRHGLESDFGM